MTALRKSGALRIGLISDTHGLLRPEALVFLQGCDHIVHAGDIGDPLILEHLGSIASVTAVRGNNDIGPWAQTLPQTEHLTTGGLCLCVVHDCGTLRPADVGARTRVVVAGHSHKPAAVRRDGIVYVNPGSAGPRRFSLPIAAGEIVVSASGIRIRVVDLMAADKGSALVSIDLGCKRRNAARRPWVPRPAG